MTSDVKAWSVPVEGVRLRFTVTTRTLDRCLLMAPRRFASRWPRPGRAEPIQKLVFERSSTRWRLIKKPAPLASATAGMPFDVTVTAVDPFGQVAVGYTGTVTFSTSDSDPGVVLPADYTFTADDGGV